MRTADRLVALVFLLGTVPAQTPDWTLMKPKTAPSFRSSHTMAYDAARQRTVLFGGIAGASLLTDTWEYDGVTWVERKPKTIPPHMLAPVMVYDARRRRVVMVGFFLGALHTWEWTGGNWVLRTTRARPPARLKYRLAYDSFRERVVFYGGGGTSSTALDTWEYDGTNWQEIKPKTNPGQRADFDMTYDPVRRRTVLFGGNGQPWHTWEWDGAVWREIKRTTAPWARTGHRMAFDTARRRVLVFGGLWGRIGSDLWEWDGHTWTELKPKTVPPGRLHHAMVYDSVRQRVVMFGGAGTLPYGDTWEWGATPTLTTNTAAIAWSTGGSQRFTLRAGKGLARKPYWLFGSITGTTPGVVLTGLHVPLNVDHYTSLLIGIGNSREFSAFRGVLDANGAASASLNVPKGLPAVPTTLHHAFVVYDGTTHGLFTVSNPVPLRLR